MSSVTTAELAGPRDGIWPYVDVARIDHSFKNSLMVLGERLFYTPSCALFGGIFIVRFSPRTDSVQPPAAGL